MSFPAPWVTTRFSGVITGEDLHRSTDEIEAIEFREAITPHRLTDIGATDTLHLSFLVIESLAERRRSAVLKNDVKSAIVAPTDVQYGFSRMFQILNDNPRIEVEIFRDMDKAVAWLRAPLEDIQVRLTRRTRPLE